jgi:hypothetical protein
VTAADGPHPDWDDSYTGPPPPWDVGRPQPAFVRLADAGTLTGALLDAGCGTGEQQGAGGGTADGGDSGSGLHDDPR